MPPYSEANTASLNTDGERLCLPRTRLSSTRLIQRDQNGSLEQPLTAPSRLSVGALPSARLMALSSLGGSCP